MGIVHNIKDVVTTLAQVPTLLTLKKAMQPRPLDEADCFSRLVEANAERIADRPAVLFEGETATWGALNTRANRYARALKDQGIGRGDSVSLMMENRIEFIAVFIAINKLGAIAALINTNLRGQPLIHCVSVIDSKKCVFGQELASALDEVRGELSLTSGEDYLCVADSAIASPVDVAWGQDLDALASNQTETNLPETDAVLLGDTATYIFTSGTTGLPKAAVLTNRRYLSSCASAHKAGLKCSETDRLYMCLPLYHGTGLAIGIGGVFSSGASVFLRRKFSASQFLNEIRAHDVNMLIYIGELCRYLVNTPAQSNDADNPLERMMGNGMRPDVWMDFKNRFGIKRITEFYAASEGNVAFANVMNKDCTIGMTASRVALVDYDVDADEIVRDANGRCKEVGSGEPGLLLGHINPNAVFEGYTDKKATEQKILRNVLEDGDAWFNTGDLVREVDVGFSLGYAHYQFVDRVGDTYRWKSENVSTNEVGEIINTHHQVKFCNVYGVAVPGTDGRAGMAAITLNNGEALDIEDLSKFITERLPAYARPVFLRIQPEIDVTGTFKMVKGELRKEAYDLNAVTDPVLVLKPGASSYQTLDDAFHKAIQNETAGF